MTLMEIDSEDILYLYGNKGRWIWAPIKP